jgi:hypothetical protein
VCGQAMGVIRAAVGVWDGGCERGSARVWEGRMRGVAAW